LPPSSAAVATSPPLPRAEGIFIGVVVVVVALVIILAIGKPRASILRAISPVLAATPSSSSS
jgi:hypothetical protein